MHQQEQVFSVVKVFCSNELKEYTKTVNFAKRPSRKNVDL